MTKYLSPTISFHCCLCDPGFLRKLHFFSHIIPSCSIQPSVSYFNYLLTKLLSKFDKQIQLPEAYCVLIVHVKPQLQKLFILSSPLRLLSLILGATSEKTPNLGSLSVVPPRLSFFHSSTSVRSTPGQVVFGANTDQGQRLS